MGNVILQVEELIRIISNVLWPLFLPLLILMGLNISMQIIFNIKDLTTKKTKFNIKHITHQGSVTLGAMIGSGTIVGFLGAFSKLYISGQVYVESVAIWALLGSLILIPVSYCESLIAKVVNLTPKEYIGKFISKGAAKIYVISLVLLYVFAIGGAQFTGIDAIMITTLEKVGNISLNVVQRYLFIAIPVIVFVFAIVFNKKEKTLIKAMIGMILVAIFVYFIFFGLFVSKTSFYIPTFIERMIIGFKNPTSALFGIPLGFIFGMQRVMQIAEPGLGTLAMAASKSDASPRVAGLISLSLTMFLVVLSIVVTSYIASFGIYKGIINLSDVGVYKLVSYFKTIIDVTGNFGFIILFIFIMLSCLTTLLGSYFLINYILENHKYKNTIIYISLITLGSIVATFRFDVIFNILDTLLLISIGLNMLALAMFIEFEWSKYRIK